MNMIKVVSNVKDFLTLANMFHESTHPLPLSPFLLPTFSDSRPLPQNPNLQRAMEPRREAVLPLHIVFTCVDELQVEAAEGVGDGREELGVGETRVQMMSRRAAETKRGTRT